MAYSIGKIYIVATPIGNLKDITFRAIETLKEVDLVVAEDTRRTLELLNHFDISKKITSYHEHNKYDKAYELIEKVKSGISIAIVTDAGTPIISDPGDYLISEAIKENIDITSVPGACAAINAIVLSGLDAKSFVFVGFLSEDNKKRKEQLESIKDEPRTMIFYISPHNIKDDIGTLIDIFGKERQASLSREMTKVHEENIRGTLKEINDYIFTKDIKGEFVLVVKGIDKNILREEEIKKWLDIDIKEHFNLYLSKGLSDKEAIKKVAEDRGMDKKEAYRCLKIK